jgi:hypothetical protein
LECKKLINKNINYDLKTICDIIASKTDKIKQIIVNYKKYNLLNDVSLNDVKKHNILYIFQFNKVSNIERIYTTNYDAQYNIDKILSYIIVNLRRINTYIFILNKLLYIIKIFKLNKVLILINKYLLKLNKNKTDFKKIKNKKYNELIYLAKDHFLNDIDKYISNVKKINKNSLCIIKKYKVPDTI